MRHIVYILIGLLSATAFGQDMTDFNRANALYNEGNYQEAISVYEQILDQDKHSAELYFNLANAYYKSNQTAPSIYYYEKALLLKPNDKDIQTNLSFAKNMTIDDFGVREEVGFSKLITSLINLLSFDGWALLSVISIILFVVLFLSYYFATGTIKKRILFVSGFTSLCIGLIALSLAFKKYSSEENNRPAIVFAEQSQVKTDPNLQSATALNLHEGTKVQILESYSDSWTKIELSDGQSGWIRNADIKPLKNF